MPSVTTTGYLPVYKYDQTAKSLGTFKLVTGSGGVTRSFAINPKTNEVVDTNETGFDDFNIHYSYYGNSITNLDKPLRLYVSTAIGLTSTFDLPQGSKPIPCYLDENGNERVDSFGNVNCILGYPDQIGHTGGFQYLMKHLQPEDIYKINALGYGKVVVYMETGICSLVEVFRFVASRISLNKTLEDGTQVYRVLYSINAKTDNSIALTDGFSSIRCSDSGGVTADPQGSYGKTSFTLSVPYEEAKSVAWTVNANGQTVGSGTESITRDTPKACSCVYEASRDNAFQIELVITCGSVTYTLTDTLGACFTAVGWNTERRVVTVGKGAGPDSVMDEKYPDGRFECALPAVFNGKPMLDLIYPVGSIYMSVNEADPSVLFGGSWSRIKGRFLLGAGANDANTSNVFGECGEGEQNPQAGEMGGEYCHTLTVGEMPSHTHSVSGTAASAGSHHHGIGTQWSSGTGSDSAYAKSSGRNAIIKNTANAGTHTHSVSGTAAAAGSGDNHNNMPPYLAVFMWKRTA